MLTVEIHSTGVSAQVRSTGGALLAEFWTPYRFLDAGQWAEARGLALAWPDRTPGSEES